MTNYKDTLNLPSTEFPMKAGLPKQEPQWLEFWRTEKIYQKLRETRKNAKKFIFHDGPPYANGHIHLGHVVNKTLKDIAVKSRTMDGFNAPYVPGWDCHGLPIELNVEKKLGKNTLTPKEFRQACRDYAQSQIDVQREAFKRLGVLADWDNPYLTMNFSYEANIIRSLKKIYENGHLHRGFKPVHWCIECGSALAEAEVEYQNKKSHALDVRFRVIDESAFLKCFDAEVTGEGPISVPIWTTTPWTLPANQAVALNPHLNYVLVQIKKDEAHERLLISEALLDQVMQRYGVTNFEILSKIEGSKLEGILLKHPFYTREVPIVLGDHVTIETGTGAVHTAPAHGLDDYTIGIHYHLPLNNPVDARGCFLSDTPLVGGKHIKQAEEFIIELLQAEGTLLSAESLEHSYPFCWRHKKPLIFRATPQWFIGMDQNGLRKTALEEISKVTWLPSWGKERIFGMIEQRPDWCISRQRIWCMPMCLFLHKETQDPHPETPRLLEEVAKLIEKDGLDAWYELSKDALLGKDANQYEKSLDGLDVWFDSGVSHYCVLAQNPDLAWPADLYLEGSDQHRGWFHSSLLTSVAMNGQAPYRTVLTHGFTVDTAGHKMSKSLGNVVAPEQVFESSGADILRLWVAMSDYRGEIAYSNEIIKRISDTYRRIRNTARFLLANLHDFDPTKNLLKADQLLSLDRWIIARAAAVQKEIQKNYDNYQFHAVCQQIHQFCAIDLGGFYLDIIKDRQYTLAKNSIARRSAQTAIHYILQMLVRWMAPILSFTAEEIWHYISEKSEVSVLLATWYETPSLALEQDSLNSSAYDLMKTNSLLDSCLNYWKILMSVREAVNKEIENLRNQDQLGSALEAEVNLYFKEENLLYKLLRALGDELRFVFITSKANVFLDTDNNFGTPVVTDNGSFSIQITPSKNTKCVRCWHRVEDVGQNEKYPDICLRCVENIESESGEKRVFA